MYKGGMSSFAKAHITIEKTLANLKDKDTFVTTMFNFYKLPSDTPGMDKMTDINDSYKKVELLENEIRTFDIKRLTFDAYFPASGRHPRTPCPRASSASSRWWTQRASLSSPRVC